MPDITVAQVTAVVGWIVAQLVAYGAIGEDTAGFIMSATATVLAAIIALADAWIRKGRSEIVAAAIAAPGDTAQELMKAKA